MNFDQRQRELQVAINAEISKSGVSGLQQSYGLSIQQTQSFLVRLNELGNLVGLAVPLKWASCDVTDFAAYNALRRKLEGADLIVATKFGVLSDRHPVYADVKDQYQHYGLSLRQNFRLHDIDQSAAPVFSQVPPGAD